MRTGKSFALGRLFYNRANRRPATLARRRPYPSFDRACAAGRRAWGEMEPVIGGLAGLATVIFPALWEPRLTTASGERRGTPKYGRRTASPSSKCVTKSGGITEANYVGDVIIVHRRLAQIPNCKLRSQFV